MIATFISSKAVLLIVAFSLASSADAQISAGYATYSNGDGGVCSSVASALPAISMNAAQFANGAACGQCIQITGSGNGAGTSPVSTAPYVAVINNVCPQCSYGDIDLQESGNGKYGISWSFVGCPGGGRKLIETSFQGDKTVYTGFAHVGKITEEGASGPEQATQQDPEQATEQHDEDSTDSEVETTFTNEVSQENSIENMEEPIAESLATEETSEASSEGHLETLPETEETVQTSRRLLRAL